MSTNNTVLRWAGGKSWLLPVFHDLLAQIQVRNYYEPFLGGASVFLSLNKEQYKHAYLSDLNGDLINFYVQVRDKPEELYNIFKSWENTEQEYYRIRSCIFENELEKAAQFLFLNQTSYNGIYRVNQQGKYNVPYGYRKTLKYDYARLENASIKLQKTKLISADFEFYKYRIKQGDLVFLDPPYTVSHNNNGFIEYNKNLFSLDDQYRLKKFIDYIRGKGAYYILTNAAHPDIRQIFEIKEDRIKTVNRSSLIGGKNAQRGLIEEFVFTNIPDKESY